MQQTGTAYTRDLIVDAIENLLALANSNAIKNPRALIRLSHAMSDLDDALQVVSYGDEEVPRYVTDRMLSPRSDKRQASKPKKTHAPKIQQKEQPAPMVQAAPMAPVREIKRPPRQEWTPPSFRDIEREIFDPEANRQTMIGVNEDYNLHHNDYLAELGRIVNPEYDPYDEIPQHEEDTDEYYAEEYSDTEYGDFPPDFDEDLIPEFDDDEALDGPIDFSDFSDAEPPEEEVPIDMFDDVYDADFDEDFEEGDVVEEYEDGTSADPEETLDVQDFERIADMEANKNAIEDLFANDPNDYIKDIPTHRKK